MHFGAFAMHIFSDVRSFLILEILLLHLQQFCHHIFHFTLESEMRWHVQNILGKKTYFNHNLWWQHETWHQPMTQKQKSYSMFQTPCQNQMFTTFCQLYNMSKIFLQHSQLSHITILETLKLWILVQKQHVLIHIIW